jgi:hypothetical protein
MRGYKMLRIFLIVLITLVAVPRSYASVIAPQFYKLKVTLTNGNSVEGYSWGISWMGGAQLQEQKVRSATLRVENENVEATFMLTGSENTVIHKQSAKDDRGRPRSLSVASHYEMFKPTPASSEDAKFYLLKGVKEYPLVEVSRIDTLDVVGKGFRISDPRKWLNLKEPYIVVEDCGLGCNVKMYSKDRDVTKEILQRLWDQHFACNKRSIENKKGRSEIEKRYQIEWISDPFCVD